MVTKSWRLILRALLSHTHQPFSMASTSDSVLNVPSNENEVAQGHNEPLAAEAVDTSASSCTPMDTETSVSSSEEQPTVQEAAAQDNNELKRHAESDEECSESEALAKKMKMEEPQQPTTPKGTENLSCDVPLSPIVSSDGNEEMKDSCVEPEVKHEEKGMRAKVGARSPETCRCEFEVRPKRRRAEQQRGRYKRCQWYVLVAATLCQADDILCRTPTR